jgi:hypothetical protein
VRANHGIVSCSFPVAKERCSRVAEFTDSTHVPANIAMLIGWVENSKLMIVTGFINSL